MQCEIGRTVDTAGTTDGQFYFSDWLGFTSLPVNVSVFHFDETKFCDGKRHARYSSALLNRWRRTFQNSGHLSAPQYSWKTTGHINNTHNCIITSSFDWYHWTVCVWTAESACAANMPWLVPHSFKIASQTAFLLHNPCCCWFKFSFLFCSFNSSLNSIACVVHWCSGAAQAE